MTNIILPKTRIDKIDLPVIFLAGPIRGAPRWHDRALEFLDKQEGIYVASPSVMLRREYLDRALKSDKVFLHQLDWEAHYLEIASKKGSILFWLPNQVEEMPINQKTGFYEPYARDTRPELGGYGWGALRYDN